MEGAGWGLEGVIKLLYKLVVMAAAGSILLSKLYAKVLEQLSARATTAAHSRALKPQLRSPCATTTEAQVPEAWAQQQREVTALRSLHTSMKSSPCSLQLEKAHAKQ